MVNRLIELDEGDIRIDGTSVRDHDVDRAAPRDRLRDPAGRPLPAHDGRGEHRHRAAPARLAEGADPGADRPSCSSSSGSSRSTPSRYPAQLSGGQRQRVGLARALAADPPLMLMDEPFGALDPITRDRLQLEFLRLHEEVRKTVIFVTHDIDEAIKLGDRIAILREGGVLAQYDTPDRILAHPADDFVAALRRRRPRPEAARPAPARGDRARAARRRRAGRPRGAGLDDAPRRALADDVPRAPTRSSSSTPTARRSACSRVARVGRVLSEL